MKKSQMLGAVFACLIVSSFSSHANLLTNASFETPDASSGDVAGSSDWTPYNDVYTNDGAATLTGPAAYDGDQSLKMFDGSGATSFAYQSVAVTPGQAYKLSARVINWAGDPFISLGLMGLTFWDGPDGSNGGAKLGPAYDVYVESTPTPVLHDPSVYLPSAIDGVNGVGWTEISVQGIAPSVTQSASVFLQIIGPSSGALYWDSVTLEAVPIPAAVWLFGSGLLGLVGIARRRKKA